MVRTQNRLGGGCVGGICIADQFYITQSRTSEGYPNGYGCYKFDIHAGGNREEMKRNSIIIIGLVLLLASTAFGMTERQNFSGQVTPSIIDVEYKRCNFSQILSDPNLPNRVRLFPGDDTPRTFFRCNLVNCETPPGSIVTKCNTSIVAYDMLIGSITVMVDGKSSSIEFYGTKFYRDGQWHVVDSVPNIVPQDIDTSGVEYNVLLSFIDAWRQTMTPRLRLFSVASDEQRRAWWNNDPLLKATLLLLRDGAEYIERLEGLDE